MSQGQSSVVLGLFVGIFLEAYDEAATHSRQGPGCTRGPKVKYQHEWNSSQVGQNVSQDDIQKERPNDMERAGDCSYFGYRLQS